MIVSPAALNRIARKVGPKSDEGVADIMRPQSVVTDFGVNESTPELAKANVPCRFQYIGDYLHTGFASHGLIRTDADLIVSFAADTDIRPHDVIVQKAMSRQASRYYSLSQTVITDPWNNCLYTCIVAGVTDNTPVLFTTNKGDEITDGSAVWRCLGKCPEFVVTEKMYPRTYGDYISKNVYAKFRQDE